MIHIAPCSCELHVRIRELEAELAEARFRTFGEGVLLSVHEHATLLARAEKAEREALAEAEAHRDYLERWNRSEARVAELERMEEHWHNRALLLQRGEPLAAIERGEREAD